MADLDETLRKVSVKSLQSIGSYQTGGMVFYPAFVLVYNTKRGHFTSLKMNDGFLIIFTGVYGGLFKTRNPNKVKYQDKLNILVFFYW